MKKFQNKPLVLAFLIIFALICFIVFKPVSDGVGLSARYLLAIPTRMFSAVFETGFELLHFKSIANENRRLKRRFTQLTSEAVATEELIQENNRLKRMLGVRDKLEAHSVICRVSGRDFSNWCESLIIDKGEKSGVKNDMAVIADGAIIGKITAVSGSNARVSLITDPEIRIAVVSQRTRIAGLIYGIARGRAIMKFIPKDSDIKPEDSIVTSSVSGIYPKGFLVGKVLSVKTEPNKLYLFALIEPAVDPMAVEEVMVLQ